MYVFPYFQNTNYGMTLCGITDRLNSFLKTQNSITLLLDKITSIKNAFVCDYDDEEVEYS
jgi:hypothetical protein